MFITGLSNKKATGTFDQFLMEITFQCLFSSDRNDKGELEVNFAY